MSSYIVCYPGPAGFLTTPWPCPKTDLNWPVQLNSTCPVARPLGPTIATAPVQCCPVRPSARSLAWRPGLVRSGPALPPGPLSVHLNRHRCSSKQVSQCPIATVRNGMKPAYSLFIIIKKLPLGHSSTVLSLCTPQYRCLIVCFCSQWKRANYRRL